MARCLQLKGNTSTSESFRVAIRFVAGEQDHLDEFSDLGRSSIPKNRYFEDEEAREGAMVPVLFLISVQNYNGFNGFRLNGEKYSAYPLEREVILLDGTKVVVMKVEERSAKDITTDLVPHLGTIDTITIIHLFAVC